MLQTRSYKVDNTKHVANKKLQVWQNKAYGNQEATRLAKQNMLQTRRYTVGKIKHVANKKLHGVQIKPCCKQEVHGWQNKTCCKQEDTRLTKQNML